MALHITDTPYATSDGMWAHGSNLLHYGVAIVRSVGMVTGLRTDLSWVQDLAEARDFSLQQNEFWGPQRVPGIHPSVNRAVCNWHKRSLPTTVYDQCSYRRIRRERKALSDDGHLGAYVLNDVKSK